MSARKASQRLVPPRKRVDSKEKTTDSSKQRLDIRHASIKNDSKKNDSKVQKPPFVPLPPRLPPKDNSTEQHAEQSNDDDDWESDSSVDVVIPRARTPSGHRYRRELPSEYYHGEDAIQSHKLYYGDQRATLNVPPRQLLSSTSPPVFDSEIPAPTRSLYPCKVNFQKLLLEDVRRMNPDPGPVRLYLEIPDIISKFVNDELDSADSIWDLVILTGNERCIWATTCGDYVSYRWPDVARTLEDVFRLLSHPEEARFRSLGQLDIAISTDLPTYNTSSVTVLRLDSGPHVLVEISEAIAWMLSVVAPTFGDPCFTLSEMTRSDDISDLRYCIKPASHVRTKSEILMIANCWMPLFPNTSIAYDQTLTTFGSSGLRLKFELMCFLSGLEYCTTEGSSLVLYGPKALVSPTQVDEDIVVWHFQDLKDGDVPREQVAGHWDLDILSRKANSFLGLWTSPKCTIGTDEADITKIWWSAARENRMSYTRDGVTGSGTIAAPKVLSLTAAVNYKVARHRRSVYQTNFRGLMESHISTSVLLYSPMEKRAWIVSTLSVLLHIARVRAKLHSGSGYEIPPAELRANGGKAAFDLILKHYQDSVIVPTPGQVLDKEDEEYTVKVCIREAWAALDCVRRESYKAKRVFKTSIVAYELADLARNRTLLHMKKQPLERSTTGWTPLLDHVELTLFYEGLYDPLIRGPESEDSCPLGVWHYIPQGFDILTASLPCLQYIAERFNPQGRMRHITREYDWHTQNIDRAVFVQCNKRDSHCCHTLQELVKSDSILVPNIRHPRGADIGRYPDGVVAFKFDYDTQEINFFLDDSHSNDHRRNRRTHPAPESNQRPDSGYSSPNSPRPGISENAIESIVPANTSEDPEMLANVLQEVQLDDEVVEVSVSSRPRRTTGHQPRRKRKKQKTPQSTCATQ